MNKVSDKSGFTPRTGALLSQPASELSVEEVDKAIDGYVARHSDEINGLIRLLEFTKKYPAYSDRIDRKNMDGHLTASALILNETLDRILLIDHRSLQLTVQPGGHVHQDDMSLIHASRREAMEETGISILHLLSELPYDIDVHPIPANPAKNEGAHYHLDFRYLWQTSEKLVLEAAKDEVSDVRWVSLSELPTLPTMQRVGFKLLQETFKKSQ